MVSWSMVSRCWGMVSRSMNDGRGMHNRSGGVIDRACSVHILVGVLGNGGMHACEVLLLVVGLVHL
jgi:hypothetical protein